MAVTLDPILQAQLDGVERQPIAQVLSTSFASALPFDGNDFDVGNADTGLDPDLKYFSTGELVSVSVDDAAINQLRLMITDTSREQWYHYDIYAYARNGHPLGTTCCEKPDGNIAIAYQYTWYTGYIRTMTISKVGTIITSSVEVANYYRIYNPYLIYNENISKYQLFFTTYDNATTSYHVYMKESSDFSSWDAAVEITPSSFGTTKKYNNIHALVLSDNDIVVSFDYTDYIDPVSGFELTNIYYIVSTDNGSTWTDPPTAVTAYDTIGKAARHPTIAEKSTGTLYCSFHDRVTFVRFDRNTDGIVSSCGGTNIYAQDIHLYNGKLYVTSIYAAPGIKQLCGFYIVDPTDMSLVAQYTHTTTPGYNQIFTDHHVWWFQCWGDGPYMVAKIGSGGSCSTGQPHSIGNNGVVVVVYNDGVTEWVREYVMGNGCDLPAYGLDENVDIPDDNNMWINQWSLVFAWIDADTDRLYLWFRAGYLYDQRAMYGYIDLTEVADEVTGYYTFNKLYEKTDSELSQQWDLGGCNYSGCQGHGYGQYCKEDDVIVMVHGDDTAWDQNTPVIVLDAKTGVVQFCANFSSNSNMPYNGLSTAYVYDNTIYASFKYQTLYGQEEWRGLWMYNMITNSRSIVRPGYATKDQYTFYDYDFGDIVNNYVWIGGADGAFRYHTGSGHFEPYREEELPGISLGDTTFQVWYIVWDPINEDVYTSKMNSYIQNWVGVRRFNVNGDYRKGQYQMGQKTLTDLNFANQQDLTQGYFELNIVTVVDIEDILWAVWDHIDNVDDDRDLYWDNDEGETDVTEDLTDVLEISWDLEVPTELRFYLANGYKYDQQNTLSSKSQLFRRGRKVIPKLGEKVDGVEYFVQQGFYIVEETKLTYGKPNHPVLEVVARDISSLWQANRVVLTDYYDQEDANYILTKLLEDWTVLNVTEYDIPEFETDHTMWIQWQDDTFYDIIKSLLDHLEYVFYFDTYGVFSPKRLEFEKDVDHNYDDTVNIMEYTPDTSFSSFVNEIRVIGETHDFHEIVYDPEQVGSVNGTVGWWNDSVEHTIYYNAERTRKCRNPYIVANTSTGDFRYFGLKFGGKEYISYEDPEELYCIITIVGPNLIGVVVGLAIALVVIGWTALSCCCYCGPWICAACMTANLLIYALLAVANYDLEIWAMPIGKQKQTIQGTFVDQTYKDLLNSQPVVEEIEDALCYEIAQCERVAEYELKVIKYQRERIQLTKVAHLQDEIHDMLIVTHPYSRQSMQILVANLVRTLVIRGEMTDRIEGWRIL